MTCNMGRTDRWIRALLVAPLLVILAIVVGPSGVLAYVLYALAVVMVATAAVGFCPLYAPFKIRTAPRDHASV